MAKKKKLEVQGLEIRIEEIQNSDYISLTDIAKKNSEEQPSYILQRWIRNRSTLTFLSQWEKVHNPDFKHAQMSVFKEQASINRHAMSPQRFIKETNAIGLTSKSGRYGGTYAHREIALNFCYWLDPAFQVFLFKAFNELLKREAERKNLEWHISKITDNIDEVRNLLDTIPGQKEVRNRLEQEKKKLK